VVCHAVIDAVLGAAALGDIGRHFPDTDPAWAGARSLDLLTRAGEKIAAAGYRIGNVDCTVITERPFLAPRADQMAQAMAQALDVSAEAISVKATRAEGLGPEGRGECITAVAVAMLEPITGRGG
jgi:2-C-methyl-D-erythritol 2,4-cyclodiphosphate synthase